MNTIQLSPFMSFRWEHGGAWGETFRREMRDRALAMASELGSRIEILSHDGIVLDAIPIKVVEWSS